jgi:hypothetical protein
MFSVSPATCREGTRANYYGTYCGIILKCTRNKAISNFEKKVLRPIKPLPTSLGDSTDHPKGHFLVHVSFLRKESRFIQGPAEIPDDLVTQM